MLYKYDMDSIRQLTAISPVDGRYNQDVRDFSMYFSEYAYIKYRLRAEISYLIFISKKVLKIKLSKDEEIKIRKIIDDFSLDEALEVKKYEAKTKHDVKAIEYYLRNKINDINKNLAPYIHFGLTSEDTGSLAYGLMLKDSRDILIAPKIQAVIDAIIDISGKYKSLPMLGRTHGQPAVPTTLGKEFAVYAVRIYKELKNIKKIEIEAKCSGAVGNFNAMQFALPHVDWMGMTDDFIRTLGLCPNHFTTQIVPYDSYIMLFNAILRVNNILTGFCQDMWRYISDGYFIQYVDKDQVGSSTMPHKINPIDFENAEGNFGIANALMSHLSQKLAISRLQRDLSDSTAKRVIGTAFSHSYIGYDRVIKGLSKSMPDAAYIKKIVIDHWESVSEGLQTMLRAKGDADAYETLRIFVRGNKIGYEDIENFIESLPVENSTKKALSRLSPEKYTGLAQKLTEDALRFLKENKI